MNGFALNNISNCYVGSTPVSAIYLSNQLIWPSTPPPHDYSQDYFTIESLSDNNTIGWKSYDANLLKTISVSTDDGSTWTSYTSNTTGVTLATLNTGDKLLVKGNETVYGDSSYYNYFTSTDNFDVEGNIMSLIYGDNFTGQTILDSSGYNFKYLFYQCSKLISAENLILPANTLATRCYQYMFRDCSSLIITPSRLPATTLDDRCYYGMFQNCSSLTTAPELPATTLAQYCYYNMFNGCASLTTAPETLPATTLAQYCYYNMFQNCSSLTTAPELPEATSMAQSYGCMFQNCTSLNYIKCLATNVGSSTQRWVQNVAASGTFVKNANMSSWTTGNNGIPSGWTIQNA